MSFFFKIDSSFNWGFLSVLEPCLEEHRESIKRISLYLSINDFSLYTLEEIDSGIKSFSTFKSKNIIGTSLNFKSKATLNLRLPEITSNFEVTNNGCIIPNPLMFVFISS